MYVIGIDPGAKGALYALVRKDAHQTWTPAGNLLMPFVDVGLTRPELDVEAIRDWIGEIEAGMGYPCALFVLERVGYMPSLAGESNRAFSDSVLTERTAEIWGALKALRLPRERVRPMDWQRVVLGKMPPARANKSTAGKGKDGAKASATKARRAAKNARRQQIKAAVMDFCVRRYGLAAVTTPGSKARNEGLADALALAHYATTKVAAPQAATTV